MMMTHTFYHKPGQPISQAFDQEGLTQQRGPAWRLVACRYPGRWPHGERFAHQARQNSRAGAGSEGACQMKT